MEYGFVDCHCHISAREFEEVGSKSAKRPKNVALYLKVFVPNFNNCRLL